MSLRGTREDFEVATTLLTGLPRSGTTLICALLNEFSDTVALAEPMVLRYDGDRERALADIEDFIRSTRESALSAGVARSKNVDGEIPDNWFELPSVTEGRRLRRRLETLGEIRIGKPLTETFSLVIKHPAEFTVFADVLCPRYPLVALVRHPLAVLAAWQTVDTGVAKGRMPTAENYNPALAAVLDRIDDCVQRQVALMAWVLGVYSELPPSQVMRYEELIADPENHLRRFTPHARAPLRPIEHYDIARRYVGVDLSRLAHELLAIRSIAERFYPGFEASLAPYLA